MRHIFDPITGSDVTSTVQAALQSGQTLVTAYLYRLETFIFWNYNPYGSRGSFTFTDSGFGPIFVNKYQIDNNAIAQQIGAEIHGGVQPVGFTFIPEVITHNKLSYGIGFNENPVEVTWGMKDAVGAYGVLEGTALIGDIAPTYPNEAQSPANLTLKKCFSLGVFTECPFWIHQAIFSDHPSRGGTFLGTSLLFRGFIRKAVITRSVVKLSVSSLMDVFQQIQVPTQILTPNNRALPFIPAATSSYGLGGISSIPNEQTIIFNTGVSIPRNALQDEWMTFAPAGTSGVFLNGRPAAPPFRIQGNDASSGGLVTVYFYTPPVVPSTPFQNLLAQLTTSGGNQGFQNLPPPEFSA